MHDYHKALRGQMSNAVEFIDQSINPDHYFYWASSLQYKHP